LNLIFLAVLTSLFVSNERFLELGLDVLSALVSGATIDRVFPSAALEQCSRKMAQAKRREYTPRPEKEASVWRTQAVEEILVERIDQ